MGQGRANTRRLTNIAISVLALGSALLGVAVLAGATSAPTLTLTIVTSANGTCDASQPVCHNLAAGDSIKIVGAGFSAGQLASTLECNNEPSQPVVSYLGNYIPISCTNIVGHISGTNPDGSFDPPNFLLKTGTTGPPAPGVTPTCTESGGTPTTTTSTISGCSTSGVETTDAAKYPCPPTAAQLAAGDECVLAIGDIKGERAIGVVLFPGETLQPCPDTTTTAYIPCTTTTTVTTGPTTTTPTTSSSSTSSTSSTSTSSTSSTSTSSTSSTSTSSTSSTSTSSTTSTSTSTTTTMEPTTSTSTSTTSSTEPDTSTSTTTTAAPTTTTTQATQTLTGPYELYCPGTPVGDVVLNDVATTASISPANPTSGQSFSLSNYQTQVVLPQSLASAAAALQPTLTGSASTQIDMSGATPAKTPQGPFDFNVTLPSPVPPSGVTLSLPATPGTVSGFTAGAGGITVQQDSSASLTLELAGSALPLTCTSYPNNSVTPSGISNTPPTASPIAPVIALAGGGTTTTTVPATTTMPKSTTTAPAGGGGGGGGSQVVTAPSSGLAFTGPGQGTKLIALAGGLLVLLGLILLGVVDAPRRMVRSLVSVRMGAVGVAERLPKVQLPKVRLPQLPKLHLPRPQHPTPDAPVQVHVPQAPVHAPPVEVLAPLMPVQPVQQTAHHMTDVTLPQSYSVQRPSTLDPGRTAVSKPVVRSKDTGETLGRGTVHNVQRSARWLLGR